MIRNKKREDCRSKPHDESRLIQRSFDDNKGDEKKLKGQEYFMITKMMISRIKEWVLDVQDWIKNTSRFKRKFDFKNKESRFKVQASKNQDQDSRIKRRLKKDKINVTHKISDLKNYVGLISSSHLRIRRNEGNTLVDPKKVKNIKGKKVKKKKHKKGKR